MTQSIEYVVKVNATSAQKQIDDIEKKFGGVNTVVAQVDKNLVQVERDIKDLNAAIAAGGPNVEHYKRQLMALQGPTANVGRGALEASRAIEDLQYGFGGIVNNIPGLVMALGGTAGVTAAFSLVAVAANQIWKNSDSIAAAFGATGAESKVLKEQMTELARAFDEKLNAQMQAGLDTLRDLKTELRDFGLGGSQKAVGQAQRDLDDLEKRRATAYENRFRLQAKANALENDPSRRDAFESAKAVVEETSRRIDALDKQIWKQRKLVIDTVKTANELKLREEGDAAFDEDEKKKKKLAEEAKRDAEKARREAERVKGEVADIFLTAESNMLSWVEKMRVEAQKLAADTEKENIRAAEALWQAGLDDVRERNREIAKAERDAEREAERARRDAERERVREHKRALAEIARAEKELSDYQIGLVSATTGQMAGAITDYLMAKIEGEEYAEQKAIASFLSATGQQLVASGVRGVFEGAIMSANPLTPGIGAGMIATGGAAIVAGLAMAGGGAAVSSSIPTTSTGGASSATRDPGASPRGSSLGSGGGGPMIINVAYGAGGPLPEDIAREISRVVRSGDRRRGEA